MVREIDTIMSGQSNYQEPKNLMEKEKEENET